jgi:hypothetical protein
MELDDWLERIEEVKGRGSSREGRLDAPELAMDEPFPTPTTNLSSVTSQPPREMFTGPSKTGVSASGRGGAAAAMGEATAELDEDGACSLGEEAEELEDGWAGDEVRMSSWLLVA